jgi:hypothetical protein
MTPEQKRAQPPPFKPMSKGTKIPIEAACGRRSPTANADRALCARTQ